eukprot:8726103-Karenia_brevis.AAC.1
MEDVTKCLLSDSTYLDNADSVTHDEEELQCAVVPPPPPSWLKSANGPALGRMLSINAATGNRPSSSTSISLAMEANMCDGIHNVAVESGHSTIRVN